MLPEEGSTFLGMTEEAGIVDRVDLQMARATVGIVTVGTADQAFFQGVVGAASKCLSLLQVATETDTRLGIPVEHRLARVVDRMAGCTGQSGPGMGAGVPVIALSGLVATQTDCILPLYRHRAAGTKNQWLDLQWVGDVGSGWSVT